jgi:hypothetical protein
MPYDPTKPLAGTEIDAAELRSQFQGLKDCIDTVPTVTSAVIDTVTSAPPGDPPLVTAQVVGPVLHLSFSLPQGLQGPQGPQGPPFSQALVDTVSTLQPWESAFVSTTFDGSNVHFSLGLPRGADGPMGEVTAAQLAADLATLNAFIPSTNSLATLDTPMTAEWEILRNKVNEIILALRR